MSEASGPQWCDRYPSSKSIDDLAPPFRGDVQNMIQRILEAHGAVDVLDTYRPRERAFLMHYCCEVAGYELNGQWHQTAPSAVPKTDIDIDWTHAGDTRAAILAAEQMKATYSIQYPAALESNHIKRLALDMKVHIVKGSVLTDATGKPYVLDRDIDQTDPLFIKFASSFGVLHKLAKDFNHFSVDGF